MSSTNLYSINPVSQALEVLAFTIGEQEYGVDIQKVRELRGYDPVTRIANAPDYFKGVVNLRGIIVPIIDMRIKLGQDAPRYDQLTVVIILSLGERQVGMVVDSVSDVTTLQSEQIRPVPRIGGEAPYVNGIGTLDGRMLILVDIEVMLAEPAPLALAA